MSSTLAVVFDVDDTLYLERDYVRSGFSAVGRHLEQHVGIVGFGHVAWELFEAGRRGDIFDIALRRLRAPKDAVDVAELVEMYRAHEPQIDLLPDARLTLASLHEHGVPLGVVTDGPSVSQHAKIRRLGLSDLVDTVVVTADLGPDRGKPHPLAFEFVEQTIGLTGGQLTYVADNPAKDFQAPHAMGWRTIRVRRQGGLHEHVDGGPDIGMTVTDLYMPLIDQGGAHGPGKHLG